MNMLGVQEYAAVGQGTKCLHRAILGKAGRGPALEQVGERLGKERKNENSIGQVARATEGYGLRL